MENEVFIRKTENNIEVLEKKIDQIHLENKKIMIDLIKLVKKHNL